MNMIKVKFVLYATLLLLLLIAAGTLVGLALPGVSPVIYSLTFESDLFAFVLGRGQLAAVGALILLFEISYFILIFTSAKQEATIWYENPEGRVEISIKAVEDFVRRIAMEIPEIKEIVPSIKEEKEGIKVITKVCLWTGSTVPTLTQKIQHEVKDKIQNVLGIADVSGVEVTITKIQAREAAAAKTAAGADKERTESDEDDSRRAPKVPNQ